MFVKKNRPGHFVWTRLQLLPAGFAAVLLISPLARVQAAAAEPDKTLLSAFADGDTALGEHRFDDALKAYDLALGSGAAPGNAKTAALMERKSIALRNLERLPEAERQLKQAIGYLTRDNTKNDEMSARLLYELADVLDEEGLILDGTQAVKQALVSMANSQAKGSFLEAELLNVEGRLLAGQGDAREAENRLLAAQDAAASGKLKTVDYLPPLVNISSSNEELGGKIKASLAHLRRIQGRSSAAMSLSKEAADSIKAHYARTSLSPYDTRYSPLVLLELANGNWQDKTTAQQRLNEAIDQSGKLSDADNLIKAAILDLDSQCKEAALDLPGALEAEKASCAIRSKLLPPYSSDVAASLVRLSNLYLKLGRPAEAAAQAKKAYEGLERSAGTESAVYADAAYALGSSYMAASQFQKQVEPLLARPVAIYQKLRGDDHPDTVQARDMLAALYLRLKNYAMVQTVSGQSLSSGEKLWGAMSPRIVPSLTNLGTAEANLKQFGDANKSLERAQSIMTRAGKTNTAEYADLLAASGVSYTLQKKWAAAAADLKQARTIYSRLSGPNSIGAARMTQLLKAMEAKKEGPRPTGSNVLLSPDFKPKAPDARY